MLDCKRWTFVLAAALTAAACATAPRQTDANPSLPAQTPAPAYQLSEILGASGAVVDTLLGPPALVRREGDGEYRRYGLSTCTLILILYPDETGGAKVRHVDAAALKSEQEKPDLSACLAAG